MLSIDQRLGIVEAGIEQQAGFHLAIGGDDDRCGGVERMEPRGKSAALLGRD